MVQLTYSLLIAFFLGLIHSFEPDHMAAVSSIIARQKKHSFFNFVGTFWGLGHTLTLMVVGFSLLFLKITLSETIVQSFEFIVALMIIVLGFFTIKDLYKSKNHSHIHVHNNTPHIHSHSHKESSKHLHIHQSLISGIIHGLAGTASILILTLTTVKSSISGVFFIMVFGIGSLVGMTLVSIIFSNLYLFTEKINTKLNYYLKFFTACFSIVFGIILMVRII